MDDIDPQALLMCGTLAKLDEALKRARPEPQIMTDAEFERRLSDLEKRLEEFLDGVRADLQKIIREAK